MFYLDTSVVLAAVLDGSAATANLLTAARKQEIPLVSSRFLRVEATHAAKVANGDLLLLATYLNRIGYLTMDDKLMDEAERLSGPLRGADAIHIAAALRLPQSDTIFLTHDHKQAVAALAAGLNVKDPVVDDPHGTVCDPIR